MGTWNKVIPVGCRWNLFSEFLAYFFHACLKRNTTKFHVILFVKGYVSHFNLQTSQFCEENGIILVVLYANATHILQFVIGINMFMSGAAVILMTPS